MRLLNSLMRLIGNFANRALASAPDFSTPTRVKPPAPKTIRPKGSFKQKARVEAKKKRASNARRKAKRRLSRQ